MSYLDRLKKSEKVWGDYPKQPKEFNKPNCLGLLGTLPGGAEKLQATATTSTWWLVHYLDGAPVEVARFPPATQADILASHPDAVAAEPFEYTPKHSTPAAIALAGHQ